MIIFKNSFCHLNCCFLGRGSAKLLTLPFPKSLRSSILILSFNLNVRMTIEFLTLISHSPTCQEILFVLSENLSRIQPLLTSHLLSSWSEPTSSLTCKSLFLGVVSTVILLLSVLDTIARVILQKYQVSRAIPLQGPLCVWLCSTFLLFTPLLPICSSLNMPSPLVPQGLCNDWALCTWYISPIIYIANSSLQVITQCDLPEETYPDHLYIAIFPLPPSIPNLTSLLYFFIFHNAYYLQICNIIYYDDCFWNIFPHWNMSCIRARMFIFVHCCIFST